MTHEYEKEGTGPTLNGATAFIRQRKEAVIKISVGTSLRALLGKKGYGTVGPFGPGASGSALATPTDSLGSSRTAKVAL